MRKEDAYNYKNSTEYPRATLFFAPTLGIMRVWYRRRRIDNDC